MAAVPPAAADANVAAQPPVPAAVPAAAPLVVPFALTPGLATQGIIDFTSSDGKKFYYQATKSIFNDPDEKYDGSQEKLQHFLYYVGLRATEYGWNENGILDIDLDNGETINLITRYGEVTLQQVVDHVATYMNTPCRAAQDSTMLFHALNKSISSTLTDKIRNKTQVYIVNGASSGEIFLRLIIMEVKTDTNATLRQLYKQVQNLPNFMQTVKNDVNKFNLHVEEIQAQLQARGASSTELLGNLFDAYQSVQDQKFIRYIEYEQNLYDKGEEVTVSDLMSAAATKYQTMLDADEWEIPSSEQEQIVALKAELVQLKKDGSKSKSSTNNSKGKKTNNGKKNNSKKGKPDWMTKTPTPDEQSKGNKKKVNGKQYYWCPNHKAWVRHKPEDCKGVGYRVPNGKDNENDSTKQVEVKETVIAPYNAAVGEDDEDEE